MLVGCRYNQFFLSYIFFVLGSLFFVSQTCNSVIYNARVKINISAPHKLLPGGNLLVTSTLGNCTLPVQGTPDNTVSYKHQIIVLLVGKVFSRLIASRFVVEVLCTSSVSVLCFLCYVLRAFSSAVSWFCWQTSFRTDLRAKHVKRTKTKGSSYTKRTSSCYWNYQVISEVNIIL